MTNIRQTQKQICNIQKAKFSEYINSKNVTSMVLLVLFAGHGLLAGCTGGGGNGGNHSPITPPGLGCIDPNCDKKVPFPGDADFVQISNGAYIKLQNIGGIVMFEVEGALSDEGLFAVSAANSLAGKPENERLAVLQYEIKNVTEQLRKQTSGSILSSRPWIGYFRAMVPYRADLMSDVKKSRLSREVVAQPVVFDLGTIRADKTNTAQNEGLTLRPEIGGDMSNFSGLKQMGAIELSDRMEKEFGIKADGSSVRLGITDTGITFNHPTFLDSSKSFSRVVYMKDFTGEGTVYVNPAAKLTATPGASDDELILNAEIISTPRKPATPNGDLLQEIKDLKTKVSPELKAILLDQTSGAKLAILLEDAFQSDSEPVDINANGKVDDKLYIIYVPASNSSSEKIYFDPSGTADFRKSSALKDFNKSKDTTRVYAERVGFSIEPNKLPHSNGKDSVVVKSIAIVGFDPGNHGSHVAGIAGGRQTIINDISGTLARGVAPEAQILMGRVCANNGGCSATEAMIDLAETGAANVINMSLGGLGPFNDGSGVQEMVVNRLTAKNNVLFMISAGNAGPGRQTVGSPSTARLSMSVGAAASRGLIQAQYQWDGNGTSLPVGPDDAFMLFFSSRGPTGGGGFKPMISAPGTELSSVQLNAAPGNRQGLDVYWGTSMAAPAATGAYALLLDSVQKFNLKFPDKKLSTNVFDLRRVLMESAKAFDVKRRDPNTGKLSDGQYTWIDQGTGMINASRAFRTLETLRDHGVVSVVRGQNGQPVELDYIVYTTGTMANGNAYDGTRAGGDGQPVFGSGLFLNASDTLTMKSAYIGRRLPEGMASGDQGGDLALQLANSMESFRLVTTIDGSDKVWLVAGVPDRLNCEDSLPGDLTLVGRGVEVEKKPDGTGTLNPFPVSNLNICFKRELIRQLPPGDHGALISGYRKSSDGSINPVASFVVPVLLTVPHQTLKGATGYSVSRTAKSFSVTRNYIMVPPGTSSVRVQLEVPALKVDAEGNLANGDNCAGVELMSLEGSNVAPSFTSRAAARAVNCKNDGTPITDKKKRMLSFSRANPTAGMWDLHVFGLYKFAKSDYTLRVDYITATPSKTEISGDVSALVGNLSFVIKDASIPVQASARTSSFELSGLKATSNSQVEKDKSVYVKSPLGVLRSYPSGTKNVTVTTGGAKGNDIDLGVLECPAGTTAQDSAECKQVGSSGGATDEETVTFAPKKDKLYVVRVDGFEIKDDGKFTSDETIFFEVEPGTIALTNSPEGISVDYAFGSDLVSKSNLLNSSLFAPEMYGVVGELSVKTEDEMVLGSVAVSIKKAK